MSRIRVGVVGAGKIFRGAHLPSYPNINEAQLVGLCDLTEDVLKISERRTKEVYIERAQKAEEKGEIDRARQLRKDMKSLKTYSNIAEMFSKEELDLVDICTPTKFHSQIAIEALNHGINAMAEKPMARTYLECLNVVEAVKDNKKLYQHNENWIYSPLWYNARKFIESGMIGELQLVFLSSAHGGPENLSWFWDPDIAGGGALLDNGVHAITCAWFLTGFDRKPTVVKAVEPDGICIKMKTRILQGMFRHFEVEDDAHIMIRFEDNNGTWSTAHVEGSWSHRDSMETAIIGSSGIMRPVHKEGETFLEVTDVTGGKRELQVGRSRWTSGFAGEIRNMCNCVLNDVKPICDEHVGAETTAIVQAAYLSQKRGKKPVKVKDFKRYAFKIRDREGKNASDVLLRDLLKGIKKT